METHKNTGIFFTQSLNGYYSKINLEAITSFAKQIPNVKTVFHVTKDVLTDSQKIETILKSKEIERVILVGEYPGLHKTLFTKAIVSAGLITDNLVTLSFREKGIFDEKDTEKAKLLLEHAVKGSQFFDISETGNNAVNDQTLVIGAGIAGIQASLEIADAGKKVFLVEKTGTIGGHMAMFDKTFPTLDCAACILTPKMVEIGQHSNIDLITYAEVKSVSGTPGNYKVTILKKARCVDLNLCIGCGSCSTKCPSKVPSEFDSFTTLRKAIYIPFPQAVPNKYLVDKENCTYVNDPFHINAATLSGLRKKNVPEKVVEKLKSLKGKSFNTEPDFIETLTNTLGENDWKKYSDLLYENTGKCKNCIKFCPVNDCINLDEKDEEIEINVGNIIVATGFTPFDASRAEQFGYGVYDNVLTSLELERLINASGPTEGKITLRTTDKKGNKIFTKEGKTPSSIALVHCVGSRDENHNKYCSKVCCMYSLKLSHLIKEKLPDADVFEYFIDMRAFGKGYEEFYERINNEGIDIIRGKTAKAESHNGALLIRGENILESTLIEQQVDMLILAVGLVPNNDSKDISEMLNIKVSDDGWFVEADSNTDTTGTYTAGILTAGVCQSPKDIPDTVAQASAAASKVLQNIMKGKI
ncbi:MAG: disulfide reductase [Bacteroidetes bacterium]|nr:MAG: disulfide reductase [Bacteroidota bacterium]